MSNFQINNRKIVIYFLIFGPTKIEKLDAKIISQKYIVEFEKDYTSLKIPKPSFTPKCTDHIDDIIIFISELIDNNFAYYNNGHVFFSIKKFYNYGKLSGKNVDDLLAGHRVKINDNKKNPLDFEEGVSGEVNISSFKTGIALPKDAVRDIIAHKLGMPEKYLKIRSENDPLEYSLVDNAVDTEITVGESDPADSALMNEYEADEHKAEDYHGNEFNTKFVDELMKLVKDRDQHVSKYMKGE